jgi:Flp pilus assembly protein TadG
MFMAVPMFGALGLVVDVGWAYFTRQVAHAAAESAALAAAQTAVEVIKTGGSYTCGSSGSTGPSLRCQAATACPTTVPTPTTNTLQNGCAYAIANGFSSGGLGGKQSVTMQADITTPSPNVPGVTVKY